MIQQEKWKWFGHAGHFICASRCRFNLHTKIGKFIVSTIGDYHPDKDGPMDTIGAGKDAFFETFIFLAAKTNQECGCPQPETWEEIDSERYATHEAANKGHIKYCRKYARKQ